MQWHICVFMRVECFSSEPSFISSGKVSPIEGLSTDVFSKFHLSTGSVMWSLAADLLSLARDPVLQLHCCQEPLARPTAAWKKIVVASKRICESPRDSKNLLQWTIAPNVHARTRTPPVTPGPSEATINLRTGVASLALMQAQVSVNVRESLTKSDTEVFLGKSYKMKIMSNCCFWCSVTCPAVLLSSICKWWATCFCVKKNQKKPRH